MHLIQLLLPISDNEGRPIDEDAFTMVRRELTEHFGGVTAYMRAPASGLWKRSPGDIEHDDLIMVEVVTDALDRGWWHDYRPSSARGEVQAGNHSRSRRGYRTALA